MENSQSIYTLSTDLFLNSKRFGLLNVFWLHCIEKNKAVLLLRTHWILFSSLFIFYLLYIVVFPDLTY